MYDLLGIKVQHLEGDLDAKADKNGTEQRPPSQEASHEKTYECDTDFHRPPAGPNGELGLAGEQDHKTVTGSRPETG